MVSLTGPRGDCTGIPLKGFRRFFVLIVIIANSSVSFIFGLDLLLVLFLKGVSVDIFKTIPNTGVKLLHI